MTTVAESDMLLNQFKNPVKETAEHGTLMVTVIAVPVPGAGLADRLGVIVSVYPLMLAAVR